MAMPTLSQSTQNSDYKMITPAPCIIKQAPTLEVFPMHFKETVYPVHAGQ